MLFVGRGERRYIELFGEMKMAVYSCQGCTREFYYIYDYRNHLLVCHGLAYKHNKQETNIAINCRKCCVAFHDAERYSRHVCKENVYVVYKNGNWIAEETKMTRAEAIKKVEIVCNSGHDAVPAGTLIAALEALGLLKFDEEKEVCWTIVGNKVSLSHLRAVVELDGYKIVDTQTHHVVDRRKEPD